MSFPDKSDQQFNLKNKQQAYNRGLRAESLAAWYLRMKGFAIIERRYRNYHGEIDLIARRFNLVLIVEVKARHQLSDALEAFDRPTKRRLERAALAWLAKQKYNYLLRLRFDLIAICPWRWPKHIKNC